MKNALLALALMFALPAHAADTLPPQEPVPQMIVYRFATVINDVGVAVPDVNVMVQLLNGEGWITDAAPSSTQVDPPPPHALVIDARGKYLMPGLIDVHTHQIDGEAALAGYLYTGVTTVADVGSKPDVILPLRDAERARKILSPRIFTGGKSAPPVADQKVSEGFITLMKEKRTPFATTLAASDAYARLLNAPQYLTQPEYAAVLSPAARETLRTKTRDSYKGAHAAVAKARTEALPIMKDNIRRLVTAGGIAALGTNQSDGAAVYREMELLAEAGLSPADIVTIATRNGAMFLGKADELGSVEVGKRADLILLDRNPLADIQNIKSVVLVMKDGRLIDEAKLPLAGGPQQARYTRFSPSDHHP